MRFCKVNRCFSSFNKMRPTSNPCYNTKLCTEIRKTNENRISGMAHRNFLKLCSLGTRSTTNVLCEKNLKLKKIKNYKKVRVSSRSLGGQFGNISSS